MFMQTNKKQLKFKIFFYLNDLTYFPYSFILVSYSFCSIFSAIFRKSEQCMWHISSITTWACLGFFGLFSYWGLNQELYNDRQVLSTTKWEMLSALLSILIWSFLYLSGLFQLWARNPKGLWANLCFKNQAMGNWGSRMTVISFKILLDSVFISLCFTKSCSFQLAFPWQKNISVESSQANTSFLFPNFKTLLSN